tara:strand:- start:315 stop:1388 length:1074 start_codon:yes stop_codon:yes gene_type:complete
MIQQKEISSYIYVLMMLIMFLVGTNSCNGQEIKKVFKFSTFYAAFNGGTSVSDIDTYSITNGLETSTVKTPFDYSISLGLRKIARFGYENRANTFYDGTEDTYSDAATIGKIKGFEFLFETDYKRQQGNSYLDQHHFLRYVADKWIAKVEYLEDGFADIQYFEASQRYRQKIGDKLSLNVGTVQRLSEPYGYDPLKEWLLSNGNLHYTQLAIEQDYSINFGESGIQYLNPNGNVVAENNEVWEAVVVPEILADYVEQERNALSSKLEYSIVIGFDYYHYEDKLWLHSWGNLMPYHLDTDGEFSYHKFNDGQWLDYSGGLIFGWKFNKNLGVFLEGKYNKYWNRQWHDFKLGVNYIII